MKVFKDDMKGPNQLHVKHEGVRVSARDLLFAPKGEITEAGIRANIGVSLRYLDSWLRGNGCVAINNLMEDAATVEICRAQIWEWIYHETLLSDGRRFTPELFRTILKNEIENARLENGGQSGFAELDSAGDILDRLATERRVSQIITLLPHQQMGLKKNRSRKPKKEGLCPFRGRAVYFSGFFFGCVSSAGCGVEVVS